MSLAAWEMEPSAFVSLGAAMGEKVDGFSMKAGLWKAESAGVSLRSLSTANRRDTYSLKGRVADAGGLLITGLNLCQH